MSDVEEAGVVLSLEQLRPCSVGHLAAITKSVLVQFGVLLPYTCPRRQASGIDRAKARAARMQRRAEDTKLNTAILSMLRSGQSWNTIILATGCYRTTPSRLAERLAEETAA